MNVIKNVIARLRYAAGQVDLKLADDAEAELAAMQARIEKLEDGIRRIVNGEYDNARTIEAAEKFARELLKGDK